VERGCDTLLRRPCQGAAANGRRHRRGASPSPRPTPPPPGPPPPTARPPAPRERPSPPAAPSHFALRAPSPRRAPNTRTPNGPRPQSAGSAADRRQPPFNRLLTAFLTAAGQGGPQGAAGVLPGPMRGGQGGPHRPGELRGEGFPGRPSLPVFAPPATGPSPGKNRGLRRGAAAAAAGPVAGGAESSGRQGPSRARGPARLVSSAAHTY
jgi:hypothetical protein